MKNPNFHMSYVLYIDRKTKSLLFKIKSQIIENKRDLVFPIWESLILMTYLINSFYIQRWWVYFIQKKKSIFGWIRTTIKSAEEALACELLTLAQFLYASDAIQKDHPYEADEYNQTM